MTQIYYIIIQMLVFRFLFFHLKQEKMSQKIQGVCCIYKELSRMM